MARDILSAIKHAKTSALQFSELISIMHKKLHDWGHAAEKELINVRHHAKSHLERQGTTYKFLLAILPLQRNISFLTLYLRIDGVNFTHQVKPRGVNTKLYKFLWAILSKYNLTFLSN